MKKTEEVKKYKGQKIYAVVKLDDPFPYINFIYYNAHDAAEGLKPESNILCELTITRVFTRERDLKEIETEL